MWLKHLSYRTKVAILVSVVVVGLAATHLMYVAMLSRLSIHGSVYQQIVEGKDIIADVLPPPEYVVESYLTVLELATNDDVASQRVLIDRLSRLEQAYRQRHEYWVETLADSELKRAITEATFKPADEFYKLVHLKVIAPLETGKPAAEVLPVVKSEIRDVYDEHRSAIDAVVRLAGVRVADDEAAASRATRFWFSLQALLSTLVLAIMGVVVWFITRSMVGGTRVLLERVGEMATGAADLTRRIPVMSGDEIGTLAGLINAVIQRIHDLIARARVATIQLNSTATEIAASANQQIGTMQGFAASSNEIAAAVKQISASGQGLVRTMEDVDARATHASTLATSGRAGLSEMQSTMQQLSEASGSISGKLSTIREKAGNINMVVTTITKVADQTNLLSINAAIEAEKAGEAGRGFLVVAREIRRLADQTAVATLDIEQMVRQMQAAVSAGVMEMDHFTDKVRGCIGQVGQISGQMEQVIEQVHGLTQSFQTVNESMRQQSQGVVQIDEVMLQLTTSVKQVSSSVQDFHQAAENLRDSARVLQQEVGQFTVSGA